MYSEIASNKRKTWLIIALFAVIIGALGWVLGGAMQLGVRPLADGDLVNVFATRLTGW